MAEQVKGFFNSLLATAVWDGLKGLWGPAVLAAIFAVWQKLKQGSLDWFAIVGLFVLASILAFLNFRKKGSHPVQIAKIDSAGAKLKIHRAVYGAGPLAEIDIREKLQDSPRDAMVVIVDNTLVPRDPAWGVQKRLDVDYSYASDSVVHVSRMEARPGEIVRLVLPEDTEVHRLQIENQALRREIENLGPISTALQSMAKEDAEKLGERIRQCGQRLEFHFAPGSDPYVDVTTELWNGSVFDLVSFGEIRGHGTYAGRQLAVSPRIWAPVEPVLVCLKHGDTATLAVRQFLSIEVADTMVANFNCGVLVNFEAIAVPFKSVPKFGPPVHYTWWGPRFTMEQTTRV
ncbi:MAG: hypothetical protein LAP86_28250 [Acidobacteriia bacterium]|nr:hypothetical protein [Terriglobia bacterium]